MFKWSFDVLNCSPKRVYEEYSAYKVFNFKRCYETIDRYATKDMYVEVGILEDWHSTSDILVENGVLNENVDFQQWSTRGTPAMKINGSVVPCFIYSNGTAYNRNYSYWKAAAKVRLEMLDRKVFE